MYTGADPSGWEPQMLHCIWYCYYPALLIHYMKVCAYIVGHRTARAVIFITYRTSHIGLQTLWGAGVPFLRTDTCKCVVTYLIMKLFQIPIRRYSQYPCSNKL